MNPACRRIRSGVLCLGLFTFAVLTSCAGTQGTPRVTAPPERPPAVRRGDAAFRDGNWELAIQEYRRHLIDVEQDPSTARALYKTALSEYRLGQYEETLATLREMEELYPEQRWVQVEALRGDARYKMNQSVFALQAWDRAWRLATDIERQKLRPRIEAALRTMNSVELASARRSVLMDGVVEMVDTEIAGREPDELIEPDLAAIEEAKQIEDVVGVRTAKAEPLPELEEAATPAAPVEPAAPGVEQVEPPAEVREKEAAPLVAELPEPSVERAAEEPAVQPEVPAPGVEPPDRGQQAPQGPESVASAVARALEQEPEPRGEPAEAMEERARPAVEEPATLPGRGPRAAALLSLTGDDRTLGAERLRGLRVAFAGADDRLVVRDTGTEAGSAKQLLADLADDPSVLVVISLLHTEESRRLAGEARRREVPFVFLSEQQGAVDRYTVEVGPHATAIDVLLGYAVRSAGIRRLGIVHPEEPGAELRLAAFRSSVRQQGAEVVGAQTYERGQANRSQGSVARWRQERDLQGLYVSDDQQTAVQFVDFLSREMPDVFLLGTDGWRTVVEQLSGQEGRPGRFLFTSGLSANSGRAATRGFVGTFESRYGQTPILTDAQVYDASMLARVALEGDAVTRAEVVPYLRSIGAIPGAVSDLRLSDGQVRREVVIVEHRDGRVREIAVDGAR